MTTFPKEAIAEILAGLDHKNDALWTEDGAPLVTEVQRLANDKTITRAQINDALPGFVRKSKDSIAEDEQPGNEAGVAPEVATTVAEAIKASAPDMTNPPGADELDDPVDEQARLRQLAYQRVLDAEANLAAAKEAVSKAMSDVTRAEQRHDRALQLYSAKYPPISVAENIKQHLAAQQAALYERVTGQKFTPNSAQNPVDQTLMDRKRDNGRKGNPQASFLPRKAAISY